MLVKSTSKICRGFMCIYHPLNVYRAGNQLGLAENFYCNLYHFAVYNHTLEAISNCVSTFVVVCRNHFWSSKCGDSSYPSFILKFVCNLTSMYSGLLWFQPNDPAKLWKFNSLSQFKQKFLTKKWFVTFQSTAGIWTTTLKPFFGVNNNGRTHRGSTMLLFQK